MTTEITLKLLHPDWPPFDPIKAQAELDEHGYLEDAGPVADLAEALRCAQVIAVPSLRPLDDRLRLVDLATIKAYALAYHGDPWHRGESTGTELELIAYGRLEAGGWWSVNAWNDYSGWGCQDGATVRVAALESHIISWGLDLSGRRALGLMTDADREQDRRHGRDDDE